MEINPSVIFFTIINFILLLAILKHFFFEKVKAIISQREENISNQLDEADDELQKARMLIIENERILSHAKEEGKKIIEEQKSKAEAIYQEIVNEAHEESKTIIDRAKVEIERQREKAEYQLKQQAIDLALELSKKVIEKNIDEEKNRELIGDFITKVGS